MQPIMSGPASRFALLGLVSPSDGAGDADSRVVDCVGPFLAWHGSSLCLRQLAFFSHLWRIRDVWFPALLLGARAKGEMNSRPGGITLGGFFLRSQLLWPAPNPAVLGPPSIRPFVSEDSIDVPGVSLPCDILHWLHDDTI